MNSNAQLNEGYEVRVAGLLYFFRDLISASSEIEDKELDSKVQAIQKEEDTKHIESLEKEYGTYTVKKERKSKSTNLNNVKNKVQNNTSKQINIESEKDDKDERGL